MKKLILLTAALLGCTVSPLETPTEESVEVPTTGLDPQLCVNFADDPTMVVDNQPFRLKDGTGIGQFSMTGKILSEVGEAPFSGEIVEYVYLAVNEEESSEEAFDYFYKGAAGGKLDKIVAGQLYLRLGLLKEGELNSSAYISVDDSAKILNTLNGAEEITLNMLSASTLGRGQSAESVNVCLIEL